MYPRHRASLATMLAAASLLLAPACNALTGIGDLAIDESTSTGGVDAAHDAIGSNDGATGDGAFQDDGAPVVVTDASADGDAGTDAAGDAAPLGFCASLSPAPTACTDFDDGVFPGAWMVTASGPATATSVTNVFRSGPRALHIGTTGGTAGTAYLSRQFAVVPTTEVALGFSVRVAAQRPGENELAVIYLGSSGGNPYQAQLELLDNGEVNFEEEAPSSDGSVPQKNELLGVQLAQSQWLRVTMTITMGATTSSIKFEVEGKNAVTKSALAHNYKAAPRVVLGHDSTTTSAYGIGYDDVVVNVK